MFHIFEHFKGVIAIFIVFILIAYGAATKFDANTIVSQFDGLSQKLVTFINQFDLKKFVGR